MDLLGIFQAIKHPCSLIHISFKGKFGTVKVV